MLSIVVGPGPLTDAAAEKHPGLLETQDFSPASDCDLAMLKRLINILIGAPKDKKIVKGRHLFVSVPPYLSVSKVMQYLKGKTSHKLLMELVGGPDAPEEGGAARFL